MGGMNSGMIKMAVGAMLGIVVALVMLSNIMGALNQWYLQSMGAGVVGVERFDRVVVAQATTHVNYGDDKVDALWADGNVVAIGASETGLTPGSILKLSSANGCKLATAGHDTTQTGSTVYTPSGTAFQVPNGTLTVPLTIPGCEYTPANAALMTGGLGPVITLILQAAGLAPIVAIMAVLGGFGMVFMRQLGNAGMSPIIAIITVLVLFLVVASLFSTLLPFLSTAFAAVDADRFAYLDTGIGRIGTVVSQFWGIVLVSSIITVAWQAMANIKGGQAFVGGAKQSKM